MNILQIDPRDNVLVALQDLKAGDTVNFQGKDITLTTDVDAKHKFPIADLSSGAKVTMYGVLVGTVSEEVPAGTLLHTHNLHHAADPFGMDLYNEGEFQWNTMPDVSQFEGRTFEGFHREDGKVGTANYWVVIPMVFCENRNLRMLQDALLKPLGYSKSDKYADFAERMAEGAASGKDLTEITFESNESPAAKRLFPNIDGIKFLSHSMGCGSDRGDSDSLCRLLAGYASHPNVAGVTVLSLGCQHAQVSILQDEIKKRCPEFNRPLLVFEQQEYPSEEVLLEDTMRQMFAGLAKANQQTRQTAPITKLSVGMECGGSDGFSGISANPAIGHVTDVLTVLGARAVLSEFPELCGVEADLIKRCKTSEEASRFIQIMEDYNARAEAIGSGFSMNPSPGNIKDGLITDAIKSAGAAKKGGTAPVTDVLDYTEPLRRDGFTLLCTPGNDVESTTAMTGSGCNVILFSTGLGTPTGNPICPVIKVASNRATAERHPDLIDYNAGTIIEGQETIQETGNRLLEMILEVASGSYTTKAVGLGQDDFIPWRRGVSL